jgi:hypothetical protein
VERSNLKKLSEVEVREQYGIKISDRFASLENLNDSKDINRTWEDIQDNIKNSAKESLDLCDWKQHKPWFDECLQFGSRIKGSGLNCSGYRMQTKVKQVI